jgi:hypothetical protein
VLQAFAIASGPTQNQYRVPHFPLGVALGLAEDTIMDANLRQCLPEYHSAEEKPTSLENRPPHKETHDIWWLPSNIVG